MAKEKAPAFQFYPKDFISDGNVKGMSLQERGAYITLLCICWIDGSLPADTSRLANICGTPHKPFLKWWPAVRTCFREQNDRLVHPRLELEREKQETFRRRQSDKGDRSAAAKKRRAEQPDGNRKSTTVEPNANRTPTEAQPKLNSPISDLRSPLKTPTESLAPTARSRWPIFKGTRLVVFEWQLTELQNLLGPHADTFAFDDWFHALDQRCVRENVIPPDRDNGAWLKAEAITELRKLGVEFRVATADAGTDRTNISSVESILKRQGAFS